MILYLTHESPELVLHVLWTTQSLVSLRCCFAKDDKEMYQELYARAEPFEVVLLFQPFV